LADNPFEIFITMCEFHSCFAKVLFVLRYHLSLTQFEFQHNFYGVSGIFVFIPMEKHTLLERCTA